MRKWIMLIAMIAILTSIALAGIKKGNIQEDSQFTQTVRLPDLVITRHFHNTVITGSGSLISWVGQTVDRVRTFLRTDVTTNDEGDVTIISFQDVIQEDITTTDYYVRFDPPPPPPAGDPLIIDLDRNGVPDVSGGINLAKNSFDKSRAKLFDLNADGIKDFVEWIGPNDGLIIFFENNKIKEDVNGFNLMSNAFGYKNGFEKLAENFDFNKDGKITGEELENLYIWRDLNQDAKVQKNELITFKQVGITEVGVVYGEKSLEGYAKTKDGELIKVWQWWPSIEWGIANK
ncbi:MAG: hypothetical protein ACK4GJ_03655 [bacterium]